jgi:hypothetical protein
MESRPKRLLHQVRAKPSQHVPTVLSHAEVQAVLHEMIPPGIGNKNPLVGRGF